MPESRLPARIFYDILKDLKGYSDFLTLVGGWVPFVYARHVWQLSSASLVTTADIDFGVSVAPSSAKDRTIYETLSSLDYREHHVRLGHLWPVVLYRGNRIPVEFIADPRADPKGIAAILGHQIYLNRIDGFHFLLGNRMIVRLKTRGDTFSIFCPKPPAFLYDKLGTFSSRENDLKKAKDLFYAYFVLRFSPDLPDLYRQVRRYRKQGLYPQIDSDLRTFFETLTCPGPLWIEKENGPDEFIKNVRRDAFLRFNDLRRNAFG